MSTRISILDSFNEDTIDEEVGALSAGLPSCRDRSPAALEIRALAVERKLGIEIPRAVRRNLRAAVEYCHAVLEEKRLLEAKAAGDGKG